MTHRNPEARRAYQAEWRSKNRKKIRAYARDYYRENRDRLLEQQRTRGAQPEYRKQKKEVRERRYHRARITVLRMYGGEKPRCACCGESQYEFLSIDHIVPGVGYYRNGNGVKQAGENLYTHLVKQPIQPDLYQVLCHNCNLGKRTGNHCPHAGARFETIGEWWEWAKRKRWSPGDD